MQRTTTRAGVGRLAQFDGVTPLVRHRALLWQFIQRNVELRHKGSHLGLIWSVLNPLLMLGLYVVVFGKLKDPNETTLTYALSLFVGLTLFHFASEVLGVAPTVIISNPGFVKKVVFPLEILPVAAVGASFVHFLITMGLALVGVALFGPGLGWDVFWLPLIFAPFLMLTLGVAWAASAIGVFFRDIGPFTGFLSMALMFSSAIFIPVATLKDTPFAWSFLRFNPLLHASELSRDVILRHEPLQSGPLLYLYAIGLASAFAGYWVFQKLRPSFADVL